MKFSDELIRIAAEFRNAYLSDDSVSNFSILVGAMILYCCVMCRYLYLQERQDSYLCIHLRRRDYAESRPKDVPSVKWAAHQIKLKLVELNLKTVFVATDATNEGKKLLRILRILLQ